MKDFSVKKISAVLHLWLGLGSGLVVFLICITGCIYVFEDELQSFFYKERRYVAIPADAKRKPLSELIVIAQNELGQEHPVQQIEIPAGADRSYIIRPEQIRNPKAYTYFGETVYYRKIYINPYSGEIIKNENTKYEFFSIVLRLHRNLLLRRSTGSIIIGSAVIIFVIMLITGIILWWPKNKAALKQRIAFIWKKTTRWKRKNYDLHNVLGFYASFFLLVIALTGLVWSFDWFENSVKWIANGGHKSKKVKAVYSDSANMNTVNPIDNLFRDALNKMPDAEMLSINLPKTRAAVVSVVLYPDELLTYNRIQLQYDQYSGKLITTGTFGKKDAGEKLRALNYDIHTGAILSLPGKILAFSASLIAASLTITGFCIWYGKRKKTKKAGYKKAVKSYGSLEVADISRSFGL